MSDSKDLTAAEILALERGERTVKESLTVDLKPCPFCGGAVSRCDESPLYGGSIMHDETECLFKDNLLFHGNIAERWNSRPLEDSLRARIAELEKRATRLAQEYCELAEVWQKHECNPAPPEEVSNET